MFEAEEKHNKDHTPNLALPSAEQQAEASVLAITGVSPEKDTRPKQVENWKFKTFNSVMFVPNGEWISWGCLSPFFIAFKILLFICLS